jgi:hypothetical protein
MCVHEGGINREELDRLPRFVLVSSLGLSRPPNLGACVGTCTAVKCYAYNHLAANTRRVEEPRVDHDVACMNCAPCSPLSGVVCRCP